MKRLINRHQLLTNLKFSHWNLRDRLRDDGDIIIGCAVAIVHPAFTAAGAAASDSNQWESLSD